MLITGPTSIGKTFLACAIDFHLCVNEFEVIYITDNKLLNRLIYAQDDGSYFKLIDSIQDNTINT